MQFLLRNSVVEYFQLQTLTMACGSYAWPRPMILVANNPVSYAIPDSQLEVPIQIKTDGGFIILINHLPICNFGQDVILCSQTIDINLHLNKNLKSQVNKFEAVNKAYADRIKYKTAIGNIPNTVLTDHTLFTFPAAQAFVSEKIIICEMWVERLADGLISTSSPMFVFLEMHIFQLKLEAFWKKRYYI